MGLASFNRMRRLQAEREGKEFGEVDTEKVYDLAGEGAYKEDLKKPGVIDEDYTGEPPIEKNASVTKEEKAELIEEEEKGFSMDNTKAELQKELGRLGVDFGANDNKETLLNLIKEAK